MAEVSSILNACNPFSTQMCLQFRPLHRLNQLARLGQAPPPPAVHPLPAQARAAPAPLLATPLR